MSLSSRGLLTKIYESNNSSTRRTIKQKSTLNLNSFNKKKKIKIKTNISPTIKEIEKEEDNKKIINHEQIKNILKENNNNTNAFPIIPQINIKNLKIINEPKSNNQKTLNEEKNQEILEKDTKLNYKLIESSSEEEQHPLRELKKGLSGQGWQSSRFSQYPQYIYIQFFQPVLIKKIELVLHETNIPSMVKFYSYVPKNKDDFISNYKEVKYDYIGFIKTDNNERSNFEYRECRKIYINSKSLFLKLELEKNHFNKFNLFNQIGLLKLEFFGDYLPFIGGNNNNNKLILKHVIKKNYQNDFDLEKICGQKLTELKKQMNYNIEIENYMECKEIKKKIEKLRLYGKRIFDLESEKNIAINNEDFSKAIEIKNLVDKLKINLQNLDITPNSPRLNDINLLFNDFDNQTISSKKYSNINLDLNNIPLVSNSYENSAINESIYSLNNDNNIHNYNISNKNNITMLNNSISPRNPTLPEEFFGSYDETILPTVLKKLNHEETKKENETGEAEKGELEPISEKLLQEFNLIANVFGEENMRKIFSKQILWREEGLLTFIEKIIEILQKNNNSNEIISMILKLSMVLLEEKHPSGVIKTLEIIKQLFEYIKKYDIKLNIEPKVADGVLIKIKEKLGDVNPKVRAKSVSLYCYMLSLNFCDYNNLIAELIEEDIKNDNKYLSKSSSLILGKLDIFINIFNNFDDSINMKRTSKEDFPSALLMDYLIYNISNNKPEIRKKTRYTINLLLKNFGIPKFIKKLEKIEERELIKLIREIPDLQNYFPNIILNIKDNTINSSQKKGYSFNNNLESIQKKKLSKIFFKSNKRLSKKIILKSKFINQNSISNIKEEKQKNIQNERNDNNNNDKKKIKLDTKDNKMCKFCRNNIKEDEIMANHLVSNCPMFTICEKCYMNLEVKKLNYHKGNECKFKDEYKLCNNCNEYILKDEYDSHKKSKCLGNIGFAKCPLCHKNLKDSDEDLYQHLMVESCPLQKRKL